MAVVILKQYRKQPVAFYVPWFFKNHFGSGYSLSLPPYMALAPWACPSVTQVKITALFFTSNRWSHFDWIRLTILHFFGHQRIDFVHGPTLHWFLSTNIYEIDFDWKTRKKHSMTSNVQLPKLRKIRFKLIKDKNI